MIKFRKMRYKNILSTGNKFTEIDFDKTSSFLCTGVSGSGKTTLIDALTFALYGKAYRNITKPQLVNSITKKNLIVDVVFDIGDVEYRIRRGVNPNIFDIYKAGTKLSYPGAIEQQEELSNNILGVSYNTFKQVVVLSSAGYTPFMELSAAQRRGIIENILDINIFGDMNKSLKEMIKDHKQRFEMVKDRIENVEYALESIAKNKRQNIEFEEAEIQKYKEEIQKKRQEIEISEKECQEYFDNELSKFDPDLPERQQKIVDKQKNMNYEKNKFKEQIELLQEHSVCPTCSQDIEDAFKTSKIEELRNDLENIQKEFDNLNKVREEIKKQINDFEYAKTFHNTKKMKVQSFESEIRSLEKSIQHIETRIQDRSETVEDDTKLQDDLKELAKEKKEIQEKGKAFNVVSKILKDDGLKANIVETYIPFINQTIRKYLAMMDLTVQFEIDSNFKETVKSQTKSNFSYGNFSAGEQARLNFAILLALRNVAQVKNKCSANLLILDEILDGSLDPESAECVRRIILDLSKDYVVGVISHDEANIENFPRTLKFRKKNNFSSVEEISLPS